MSDPVRLVYVFDYRQPSGYLCRVPEFLARIITSALRWHDYAPTPDGL